ncbi:uncharacterized protein LACBIDRAFT_310143 [Laccaria bicolor S238N-H82]|uniref:Predicted protein n=1 Tax=Laccaria bicolor (strain S238N-H82 / ATCC MYA-4686) TaxID=486041 RepID=B0DTX5_LACBS|nr:uncharacterized protein LACBIDRAFT_310143 [Laccaria bicolor S238N-H82]EDR01989.1 predicted protein [Laccaria bicolor S238N-H82]|eukprot:XP_001887380.1 predicted protein [Laccaria bicolor S238N-H82]
MRTIRPRNAGLTDHLPPGVDLDSKTTPDKPRMPCGHKLIARNLIVCIDGTSNQFGEKNTNVIELYNLILKKVADNQRMWYNSGIGTYARPSWKSLDFYKKVLYHKIDLAIACERFWVHTAGCRIIMRKTIVYFYSGSLEEHSKFECSRR